MISQSPSLPQLFEQLGLDSSRQAVDQFLAEHSLNQQENVLEAPFLKTEQKIVLLQMRLEDGLWADVVDELDAKLHH